jgi:hypothetical protein
MRFRWTEGVLALLLATAVSAAERERPWCGTFPGRGRLELAQHRFLAERFQKMGGRRALEGPRLEVEGDLVLLTDDGTLVSKPNPFDLRERTLVFTPSPRGGEAHRFHIEAAQFERGIGTRVVLGDDVSRSYDLPFEFPFFGQRYRRLFLNSDGNLTFVRSDSASTERSLERLLTGPPRIALFFDDLDATDRGEVRVANLPDRFVATWEDVPEWGEENANTFQVELTPDGTIQMRFGSTVEAASGIVGVSPGGDPAEVAVLDLSAKPNELSGAVAEKFQRGRLIDDVEVAKSVYRELPDSFDALVLWTNFESDLGTETFAFNTPVKNDVRGIGSETFDESASWGSAGKLQSFLVMGNLRRYPRNPEDRVPGAASGPTTLGLLGHEVGHRWLAYARLVQTGVATDALLGRQLAHWSFFIDSDASFLEGNDIAQKSAKSFLTGATVREYSRLDLYLMGLAPLAEVAPFFVVTGASASLLGEPLDRESPPRPNVTITGTRTDVTVDSLVRAMGERKPSSEEAPTTFRHAWILLSRADDPPTAGDIAQLQDARNAFERFFDRMTLGRGHVVTTLPP